ncbi:hypothetical protein AAIH46_15775 [Rhizobium sp. 0TCS1.26]|uniref:hypothetical protein n=1 Tax=Rhizobium sp. 0TCS1.26 TaxID=3142623 RepID=UPI003D2C9164
MFLSSLHTQNSSSLEYFSDTSSVRAFIEADLRNLPDFSGRDLIVYAAGSSIIIEGTVGSDLDYMRTMDVACDLAGFDRVICRVEVATSAIRI